MKDFIDRNIAITVTSLTVLFSLIIFLLLPLFGFQFIVTLMLGFISISYLILPGYYRYDNYIKRRNKEIFFITFIISIIGFLDLINIQPTYKIYKSNIEIVKIYDYYLIYYITDEKLYRIKANNIIFNDDNPPKIYKMIKTDRFGTIFFKSNAIKSNLMKKYIQLTDE